MEESIHQVKYYECDRMGVTHHSNYVRIMEETRVDMMDKLGYGFERMEADGLVSPVIEISVNYRRTTTFQDEIAVEIHFEDISALKCGFNYTMRCNGAVVCTAHSVHCFLENGRPVAIADRYPEFYAKLKELL